MRSAAEPPRRDPGLARERTALAWQRMAMGFTSLAALMLGAAAHRDARWMLVPAALLFCVAAAVWRYARRRIAGLEAGTDARVLGALAAATVAAALLAGVVALLRVG